MEFESQLFDGRSSKGIPVKVIFGSQLPYLTIRTSEKTFQVPVEQVEILEPIGKKTGILVFDRIQQIEIPDRNIHKLLKKAIPGGSIWSWVDDIENSWPLVLISIGIVVACVIGVVRWGLPAAADSIAHKIPQEVATSIGENGLKQLEKQFFTQSELEESMKQSIRLAFEDLVTSNHLNSTLYKLHFFDSEAMGANAFALPSGDIVLLDGLFDIEMTEQEILGVLAHEIAHVEKKHGLQMLLRYAGISTLIAVGFGDISSSASLLVVVPKLLVEKGYSRSFESEADLEGVKYLVQAGKSPSLLASGLKKLGEHSSVDFVPTMISSHPDIQKRVDVILELAQ